MKKTKLAGGNAALVFFFLILATAFAGFIFDISIGNKNEDLQNQAHRALNAVIVVFAVSGIAFRVRRFRKHTFALPPPFPPDGGYPDGLRYKSALEQLNYTVFDYCLSDNTVYLTGNSSINSNSTVFENAPDSLIEKGILCPDGAQECLRVFKEIRDGKASASCTAEILNADGKFHWCKIMLTNIYDENRLPMGAVGIIEDISEQKETEKRFVKEHQYREALLSSAILTYKMNFTKNIFVKGHENWLKLFGIKPLDNYSEMVCAVSEKGVHSEDSERFLKTFHLDSVLNAFKRGQTIIDLEYRRVMLDGTVMWVQCTLHLLRDPFTLNIKGIAYIKDIDDQKKKEMEMQYYAERDSLSGLYNRGAIRKLISEFLNSEEGKLNQHALLILDIDDFKSINDSHGHLQGDTVLKKVADSIQIIFRSTDILGRLGGDEFILFLKNISQPEAAIRKAKEINEALKSLCTEDNSDYPISASIGIAQCPGSGATFDELYRNADIALYQAKKNGKNNYVLFQPYALQNT